MSSSAMFSFDDLNDYCKLDVFKYLDLNDRVYFERVRSDWKELLHDSMTHLDLTFLKRTLINDVYVVRDTDVEYFWMWIFEKFANLQTLSLPDHFPLDFGRLASLCPNLMTIELGSQPIGTYDLEEFCMALEGTSRLKACRLFGLPNSPCIAKKVPELSELVLGGISKVNHYIIDWLGPIAQQITQLSIIGKYLTVDVIKKFKSLTKLTIFRLTKDGALALVNLNVPKMSKLTELGIEKLVVDVQIGDVRRVTGLTSLTSTFFDRRPNVESTLIANSTSSLQKIVISQVSTIPEGLSRCSRLTKLHIGHRDFKFPDDQKELLMKVVKNNSRLRDLLLTVGDHDDADLKSILDICPKLRLFTLYVENDTVATKRLEASELTLVEYSKRHPKRAIKFTMLFRDGIRVNIATQIANLSMSLVNNRDKV